MANSQKIMVEVDTPTGKKMVERHKVCFGLRSAEGPNGEKLEVAKDAFYMRGQGGELRRMDRTKPGKAARKATKRDKVKMMKVREAAYHGEC